MEKHLDLPAAKVLQIMQDRIVHETTYFGIQTLKSPLDLWVYQEIIFETRPDYIIEIGNFHGGSTLALAHLCDALAKGQIIGVDITHQNIPEFVRNHPRITLIEGDACTSYDTVIARINPAANILIIEDSSHTYKNTLKILETYHGLIKPGGYFIVEDGICHHGLPTGPKPGPYEAIEKFVRENRDFVVDRRRESFFLTWNPKGYLRKVK
ncbi:MAG: class I SAM-dependent methyltransferase [Chloroflexi bacterium]|nr:class I SAM-dependent methyltransferase [Chloroflexota bacterium]